MLLAYCKFILCEYVLCFKVGIFFIFIHFSAIIYTLLHETEYALLICIYLLYS